MAFKKYSRNPYNPLSDKPYKLSRSRIDNYLNCPRCFYMHERKGIKAPSGPTFSLNNAVDNLYKNEFGEQIGKSVLKPFPYSKDYMALLNKQQNEADEMQIKLMQGMLKELNTCDNCGNTIATGKKITTSEFKCPNGKNYILNSILGKKFCSPKCYSDYQKSWCDMQ